ncbi:unnamed protein product [Miscanthus lutarioriparius]|uniref:Uncharacterized protein n=1 Tax=Miscanthus lutarioriparius TaxID=422564 RepID=A0A811MU05_9POAL|nr:unnamed protein product [Miscanthus lutarioriparius]
MAAMATSGVAASVRDGNQQHGNGGGNACAAAVHAILKKLDLDYALNEKKPHACSPIYEYSAERVKEYIPKLEKWEKSDNIAKMIITCSLSVNMMRRFLSNENNTEGLSAKELHNSIKAHFRKVFLFDNLLNSRYDGISGMGNHVNILFDMAYELKALRLDVSNEFMINCLMN